MNKSDNDIYRLLEEIKLEQNRINLEIGWINQKLDCITKEAEHSTRYLKILALMTIAVILPSIFCLFFIIFFL